MTSDICNPSCVFRLVCADTYRCTQHGSVHACGTACARRFVGADAQVQCELTGRVFAAAMASHDFVAVERGAAVGKKPPKTKRAKSRRRRTVSRPAAATSHAVVAGVCEQVVHALFYGWPRALLAREQKQRLLARVKAEFLRGVGTDVANAPRAVVDACVRRIVAIVRDHAPLRTSRTDRAVVCRVAREIEKVWTEMGKTPYGRSERCSMRLEDVVLGCCYIMKEGLISEDGKELVPRSEVVAALLPPIPAVRKIGFRVKQITIGKNEVFRAFRSVLTRQR